MTAIMTFLGIAISAITAFVGFHYYKRLNPSHCVDKIRYSKVRVGCVLAARLEGWVGCSAWD